MSDDIDKKSARASSAVKNALVKKRLEGRLKRPAKAEAITPTKQREAIPLSFGQQALWFLDQMRPGSTLYTVPFLLSFEGELQVAIVQRCLEEIIARHEILRTAFTTRQGLTVQVITSAVSCSLPVVDLSALPHSEKVSHLHLLATEETQKPFDLQIGPLMRCTLFRFAKHEHVLVITMHHIITDGWSMSVLRHELLELYAAFSVDRPSPLEPLPLQYADYAIWQRTQGKELNEQLAYWKRQLTGIPAVMNWSLSHARPAVQTFQGAYEAFTIPDEIVESLNALCHNYGMTLFMVLLAAFQIVLFRYTGQSDIVVGTATANRTRAEIQGLIGFFINVLLLRTDLGGDPSLQQVLERVQNVALDAYAHQDVPFEQLLEVLAPDRTLSYNPLFQVSFNLQTIQEHGLVKEPKQSYLLLQDIFSGQVKYDLALELAYTSEGLSGRFEYSTDLFTSKTIRRMLNSFVLLIGQISAKIESRLSQLTLLSKDEESLLLEQWSTVLQGEPLDRCFQHLFEERVELASDAVILVCEGQHLTYRVLNERVNQLAHFLLQTGISLEARVGVCMERSLEMIIAFIAILKAGGVYVPLDPLYPVERLTFMLSDANVALVLTQKKLEQHFHTLFAQLPVLCLDDAPMLWKEGKTRNPDCVINPDYLAYIIYTSGSTGIPKGVMLQHRGLSNLSLASQQIFHIHRSSRLIQFASPGFDASIWELLATLLTGAVLCVTNREAILPGTALQRYIHEEAITLINQPASVLATLDNDGSLSSLETIIAAGEVCPIWLVEQWSEYRFINAYGPTEVTVCATAMLCSRVDEQQSSPPIGVPLNFVECYVLDSYLQPVPIGVCGELYIGGLGIARGYVQRPDLTAERFFPHPFSKQPGKRIYRTGDMVRFNEQGELEFIGRVDSQVKLRGFRIELGEIETILARHEQIRECVALVRNSEPLKQQLIVYVVPQPGATLTTHELRTYMRERVPDYMIPSLFLMLDVLPLTVNGKVDRQALLVLAEYSTELMAPYVAPRNDTERAIVDVWKEVLRVDSVGIHDNFFELGGSSLLITQIRDRLIAVLGIPIVIADLFEHSTVEALARYLSNQQENTRLPIEQEQSRTRRDIARQQREIRQKNR